MELTSILIIEDSAPDQFLGKVIIEEFDPDIQILQAYDGQQALEILESLNTPPNIIFLDINMPRMNGYEFLEAYEKTAHDDATIIIMLTSSNQQKDKAKAMDYKSITKYLEKPIKPEYLQELSNFKKKS